jgi:hypothetical protein
VNKEQDHSSPLRALMAEATAAPYQWFDSLLDAQRSGNGVVILEGDDGGQIYLAYPAHLVTCTESELDQLLRDLDVICWPGNDEGMARVVFERRTIGETVAGGTGGGLVGVEGWIHPSLIDLGIEPEIRAVLAGRSPRLSSEARELPRRRSS